MKRPNKTPKTSERRCPICGTIYYVYLSSQYKTCSLWCGYQLRRQTVGSNHFNWKDNAGYKAIHQWINRHIEKPSACESCGTRSAKQFHWANKDGKYSRNPEDYMYLCVSCHRKYDYKNLHKKISKRCVVCNKKYICSAPHFNRSKYCSDNCCATAKYWRNKGDESRALFINRS